MQFGHVAVALSISTYDWNPKTVIFVGLVHFLPNFDAFPIRLGWAKPSFHCTITHTFLFAFIVSLLAWLAGPTWGIFAIVSLLTHYLADMGSTVGLPLLLPFSKRKFTWALFEDTGYWGKETILGYYRQPMSWILEGSVLIFLIYRLFAIYGYLPEYV